MSLVDSSAQTPVDEVTSSLGDPAVPDGAKLCYITRTLSNEFWGFERDGFENRGEEARRQVPDV